MNRTKSALEYVTTRYITSFFSLLHFFNREKKIDCLLKKRDPAQNSLKSLNYE